MGRRLLQFISFALFYQISITSSLTPHLCPNDQSFPLLEFKQTQIIDATASEVCDLISNPSYPKTKSWNSSIDCCSWHGVKCDELSGQVIGLDLSCSQLQGVIDSNSSLFKLSHLQSLNLAFNDFSSSSEISPNFGGLASLTYLNLSNSAFSGQLPSEFLRLSNLITLDLTSNFQEIKFDPSTFKLLLKNLTKLREVHLSGTDISSTIPSNLSVSIAFLNLVDTNLYGTLPEEIFNQPNLQSLELFANVNLSGRLPMIKSNSSNLRHLDLSSTGFSGEVPESIGNLKLLNLLDLSFCNFWGSIPESLGNLTQINTLALFSNNFSGQVPSTFANLEQLLELDLSSNNLQGPIPDFFNNFKELKTLSFANNFFKGQFPSSVTNLTQLESLELSNNSLTGPIPSMVMRYPNLKLLFLADNSFNGTIPSWVFSLPSLGFLNLRSNQLTGQIIDFQYQSLWYIDLRDNQLYGPVPKSVSELENLTDLNISSNNFSGEVEIGMFSAMTQLRLLDLSYNSLSLVNREANTTLPRSLQTLYLSSCGIENLDFLRGANNLGKLDLSNSKIHGQLPQWMGHEWGVNLFYLNLSRNFLTSVDQFPFQNIAFLDLRSNLLQGPIIIPPVSTLVFFASNNNLTGEIPSTICKLNSLIVLDVSNNSLSGVIPQCLGNVSSQLTVLDMHRNLFRGNIPATFIVGSNLRSFNLRNNQLNGTVPQSLYNCKRLEVLDLGNNNLNGTFPKWLETLPKLQVLILRSNNFQGSVITSGAAGLSFSALRMIDLSNNEFIGTFPARVFENLKGMMRVDKAPLVYMGDEFYQDSVSVVIKPLVYMGDEFYQDSVSVVIKGMEITLVRILTVFSTLDLSSNKFEGEIPDIIGNLSSLRALNISHNLFRGKIPSQLGNLAALESLDLSSNQLVGEIPQKLTDLTSISVLNLSQNHLIGRIPQGNQFNTFQNDSYLGNSDLCGPPLSKICGGNPSQESSEPPPESLDEGGGGGGDGKAFVDGFTREAVLIGYGSGMVLGLVMACLMFFTEEPKWFIEFVDKCCYRLFRKMSEVADSLPSS